MDVNLTPAEDVTQEVVEESGFQVWVGKLAAVWDRTRQGHSSGVFSCYKLFYICGIVGGAAENFPPGRLMDRVATTAQHDNNTDQSYAPENSAG